MSAGCGGDRLLSTSGSGRRPLDHEGQELDVCNVRFYDQRRLRCVPSLRWRMSHTRPEPYHVLGTAGGEKISRVWIVLL